MKKIVHFWETRWQTVRLQKKSEYNRVLQIYLVSFKCPKRHFISAESKALQNYHKEIYSFITLWTFWTKAIRKCPKTICRCSSITFDIHSLSFWSTLQYKERAIELNYVRICSTVNSQFKKDINLQIHLHKAFFSANQFLDSVTLPKIHTSHQYLEDLEWFEAIFKIFAWAIFDSQRTIKVEFRCCDLEILQSFLKVWLPTSRKWGRPLY